MQNSVEKSGIIQHFYKAVWSLKLGGENGFRNEGAQCSTYLQPFNQRHVFPGSHGRCRRIWVILENNISAFRNATRCSMSTPVCSKTSSTPPPPTTKHCSAILSSLCFVLKDIHPLQDAEGHLAPESAASSYLCISVPPIALRIDRILKAQLQRNWKD